MDVGPLFVVLSIFLLGLRVYLYKVSNPFWEPDKESSERLPQMMIILLFAAVFMIFGVYFMSDPIPTFTSTAVYYPAYNVTTNAMTANVPLFCSGASILTTCPTTNETSSQTVFYPAYNVTTNATTAPLAREPSWQIPFLWIILLIYLFFVAIMILIDGLTLLSSSVHDSIEQ